LKLLLKIIIEVIIMFGIDFSKFTSTLSKIDKIYNSIELIWSTYNDYYDTIKYALILMSAFLIVHVANLLSIFGSNIYNTIAFLVKFVYMLLSFIRRVSFSFIECLTCLYTKVISAFTFRNRFENDPVKFRNLFEKITRVVRLILKYSRYFNSVQLNKIFQEKITIL
jgi:hypothetical protein